MSVDYNLCATKYKAIIFDVDGTIYYQSKMRLHMFWTLIKYYVLHLNAISELKIIWKFRSWREHNEFCTDNLETNQYTAVASLLQVSTESVKKVIEKWMFQVPLQYLQKCCDNTLRDFIIQMHKQDIVTIAYSDYPVDDKLKVLEILMDYSFCATDSKISCLKPNPKGITAILNKIDIPANKCLFIGDRYEKDGKSAQNVGMDYLILPSKPRKRNKLYNHYKNIFH